MSKKKLVTAIVAGVLIVAIGVSSVLIYRKSHNTEAALADNQRYVYAYVSDIQGNEITYMEMDESVVTAYLEQQEEASTTDDGEAEKEKASDDNSASDENAGGRRGRRENTSSDSASDNGSSKEEESNEASDEEKSDRASSGDMPSGDMPSGGMPSGAPNGDMSSGDVPSGAPNGDMPSGGMPSGDMPSGGMPSGDSTDGTEQTENGMPSKASGKSGGFGKNAMGSGETVIALIPVGITVHTSSDAKTTFNRLVAGDMIKILMETNDAGEEVIVEIWML